MCGRNSTALYTREEIGVAIVCFNKSQKAKIKLASQYFAARSGIDPRDLVNSAVERLLSNSYPKDCDLLNKLLGAIISIASGKDSRARCKIDYVDPADLSQATDSAWFSSALAEGEILSLMDMERLTKILDEMLKDRPLIKKVYEGRRRGLTGERLRAYVGGITQKQQEAAVKRLTRMLARLKDSYNEPQA
jgi:hypothetical protein